GGRGAGGTAGQSRGGGSGHVFVRREGAHAAGALGDDTSSPLPLPKNEPGALDGLLSTQDERGAIHGDLAAAAPPLALLEADAFTVLRACRLYRWTYDGDALLARLPALARALEHARGVDAKTSLVELAATHPRDVPR